MNRLIKPIAGIAVMLAAPPAIWASPDGARPEIIELRLEGNGTFYNISDNGEWAVGDAVNPGNSSLNGYATLVNAVTGEQTPLWKEGQETVQSGARDVTDAGDVAGWYDGKAAIYRRGEGRWEMMPELPGSWETVSLYSITPDGEYAVGGALATDWSQMPVAYHITDGKVEEIDVSAYRGRRFSKVLPGGLVPVAEGLLDLSTGKIRKIDGGMAGDHCYSPDGKWMVRGVMDESESFEYGPFELVDLTTGEATRLEDNSPSSSIYSAGIDNNGLVYGITEHDLMFRCWHVHVGKYWYDFRTILSQTYGIDWQEEYSKDREGLTGTFWGSSGDGRVVIATDYIRDYTCYIIRMPDSFGDICGDIDLLSNHYVSPTPGAAFSRLSSMSLTFDRPVVVNGNPNDVMLYDADGTLLRYSVAFAPSAGSDSRVDVVFRNFTMEEGKEYKVVIPSGSLAVKGDEERVNSEITISYKGRPNVPVHPVTISPADGNKVPRINIDTNPVVVTFDTGLTLVENPDQESRIFLYLAGDEGDELITPLNASLQGDRLMIYPVVEQRLAEGCDYHVVIEEGTFADLSGANPNERITITYHGDYTPDPPGNEKVIFSDDFNQGVSAAKWMFHEGDGNTPAGEPASWDFTADTTPWYFVRDNASSSDWAACSHSMYSPPGQSDDWMVTQRLYIADDSYILKFKSQSYQRGKEDYLKVYVWESDDVITALTPSIVNNIRYAGRLVYSELQDPGASEQTMEGDWRLNEVGLGDFAGKNIYVAFVNDNYNQSAIFMDDVEVSRDLQMAVQLFTPEFTVGESNLTVSGRVQNLSAETIDAMTLTLLDAAGSELDRIEATGLGLSTEEMYPFSFDTPLGLTIGEETYYSVAVTSGERSSSTRSSVKNLAFQTTRRVVLEEMTGTTCRFCPQGHVVIERLEKDFGENFIPIAIHSYPGGQFYTDESYSYSQFLGLAAAPTAVIDRLYLASPLGSEYEMVGSGDNRLWYDIVAERIGTYADADINIEGMSADADGNVNVDVTVRYAFRASNLNVNLLTVVTEDGISGVQLNNFVDSDAPVMADWEAGGPYGQPNTPYTFTNVMRGAIGTTFNGTGGYLPSEVEAATDCNVRISFAMPTHVADAANTRISVLMIDANTGRVINAARKAYSTGICNMAGDGDVSVRTESGSLRIESAGDFSAAAYSPDGRLLGSGSGADAMSLDLRGYRGLAIVKVVKDGGSVVKKIMLE